MKRLVISLVLFALVAAASAGLTKAEENSCLNSSSMTFLSDTELKATVAQGIDENYLSYVTGTRNIVAAKIILWDEIGSNVSISVNADHQINNAVARR